MNARWAQLRRKALIAPLASVLALLCLAASAGAAQVGLNSDITWGIPSSSVSQEVSATTQAGVPWIRATIDLSGAEYYGPRLNTSYLSGIDSAVQAARNAGLNVLLELDRTPYWASADPNKYVDSSGNFHWNEYYRYTNTSDYAQVVTDVVNHYKAMGVNAYEVWNEPNNPSFWPSGVNASEYVALLKAAYPAIKAADPSATVLMAGLENDGTYNAYTYLQSMYNAGAKGNYDAANFHIYPSGDPTQCATGSDGRPSVNSFCLLNGLRSEMAANGDSSPAWVTELGWSTCTQTWCATQQQQASYVTSAYQLLAGSSYSWVQKAFIYQTRDLYTDTSNTSWGSSLGIMTRDFTPKASYYAVKSLAGGSTATSGGSTGPTVALTSPSSGSTIGSSITAAATASDSAGVTKVVFSIDGTAKATDYSAPYSASISTKKLANGTHTVTATAYDAAGLTARSSVTVYKGTVASVAAAHDAGVLITVHVSGTGSHKHVTVSGRAGHGSGRVVLVLQRRVAGRWHSFRTTMSALRTGHYRAELRVRPGAWRVWASFHGQRSAARSFRIA